MTSTLQPGSPPQAVPEVRTFGIVLGGLALCHMINDTLQSLLPALYPVLQANYALTFTQIGLLHFAFQFTASLLQPVVGLATDRRPRVRLLPIGMGLTLSGLVLLAFAHSYLVLIAAAMAVGLGSAIFHPDSSRLARLASGGRFGFAQSLFQVGGNAGTALGPLLAAYVVLPLGQPSVAWFTLLALAGMAVLWRIGTWAKAEQARRAAVRRAGGAADGHGLPRGRVLGTIGILLLLIFSKHVYVVSLASFYTFYLIDTFGVTVRQSQLLLFLFLAASAVGTFAGGPIGDRIGRKAVIWVSILGVLPFTLLLPHANLVGTAILSVLIGLILSSAFSAIVVYAQNLVPNRIGLISGLFFGFAFGVAGAGAALIGMLADAHGVAFVFQLCAWLPAIGLLAAFLPRDGRAR